MHTVVQDDKGLLESETEKEGERERDREDKRIVQKLQKYSLNDRRDQITMILDILGVLGLQTQKLYYQFSLS